MLILFDTKNDQHRSRIAQTIAFGFNYKWLVGIGTGKKVITTPERLLLFNTNNLTILCTVPDVPHDVICDSFDYLYKLFDSESLYIFYLNEKHRIIIDKVGIHVGCVTIEPKMVTEIIEKWEKVNKENEE